MLVYLLWLWWVVLYGWRRWFQAATQSRSFARHSTMDIAEEGPTHFTRRKPEWVIHEVLRLNVLVGVRGCRVVADTFNGLHAAKSACTVGKTFVSDCLKANQYALSCLRTDMRNKLPRPVPINAIWAMDLTFYTDASGNQQMALGILDHGSRLVPCLQTLVNKRSWTLLGYLCLDIGKPSRVESSQIG